MTHQDHGDMGEPLIRLTDVAQAYLVQKDFLQYKGGYLCTDKNMSLTKGHT